MLFSVLSPSIYNIACLSDRLWRGSDRMFGQSKRRISPAYLLGMEHIEGCKQEIVDDCVYETNYVESLGQLNSGGGKSIITMAN